MISLDKYYCPKCNSTNLVVIQKGPHLGLYCGDCAAYVKWISKKEADTIQKIKEAEIKDFLGGI